MSLTPEQINQLEAPLSSANVKQNPRGYDYVEGWHVIAEANRIFGFGEWDRQTVELRPVADAYQTDNKWRVAYMARVRIVVRSRSNDDAIVRDGCGYGSGIDRDLHQAHESALKEAETDAMKRALMTFGNPFGLALYDKEKANVVVERTATDLAIDLLRSCKTADEFKEAWESNRDGWKGVMSDADWRRVQIVKVEMVSKLTPKTEKAAA